MGRRGVLIVFGAGALLVCGVVVVTRKPTATRTQTTAPSASADHAITRVQGPTFGKSPLVAPDANPGVASVVEANRTGQHPERLTPLFAPPPFDEAEFRKAPERYLNEIVPARAFQTKQPGLDVPYIREESPRYLEIRAGETADLAVRTLPEAPVTFSSWDLGAFPNTAPSITVLADGDGYARTRFTATPGTTGKVNIIAGSPMTSGQVTFVVIITTPWEGGAP